MLSGLISDQTCPPVGRIDQRSEMLSGPISDQTYTKLDDPDPDPEQMWLADQR